MKYREQLKDLCKHLDMDFKNKSIDENEAKDILVKFRIKLLTRVQNYVTVDKWGIIESIKACVNDLETLGHVTYESRQLASYAASCCSYVLISDAANAACAYYDDFACDFAAESSNDNETEKQIQINDLIELINEK